MDAPKRPNIVGKGPSLSRDLLETFEKIQSDSGNLSADATQKINTVLSEKSQELGKILKMAYLKTVKAGEVAWDLNQAALGIKEAVAAGNEAEALTMLDDMTEDLNGFIHKIKTFVVRMT